MISFPTCFLAAATLLLPRPAMAATVVPRTYIVECAEQNCLPLLKVATKPHGRIISRMELGFYHGATITFPHHHDDGLDAATDSHVHEKIQHLLKDASIQDIWPMQKPTINTENPAQFTPPGRSSLHDRPVLQKREQQSLPLPSPQSPPPPSHSMTQIDKLHEQNVTGRGIKVAIISTGIDYNHPALGAGCLGQPDCLIDSYHNYAPDACAPTAQNVMDCDGSGTMIAGIIAAQPNPLGFVGASPDAKLNIYRVSNTYFANTDSRVVMDAISRAVTDGSSVIVIAAFKTVNTQGGLSVHPHQQHPVSRLISAVVANGTAVIADREIGSGNSARGPFSRNEWPTNARGAISVGQLKSTHEARIVQASAGVNGTGTGRVEYTVVDNSAATASHNIPRRSPRWGPGLDMDVKPQFAAPGEQMVSTFPSNSYQVVDTARKGDLAASSLIAGIYALLGELNGGKVEPALFEQVLSATAKPQFFDEKGGTDDSNQQKPLVPVPVQGAGLVQAYDAAQAAFFASTTISPASLSFNDTESSPAYLTLNITNRGNLTPAMHTNEIHVTSVTYTLYQIPAKTFNTLSKNHHVAEGGGWNLGKKPTMMASSATASLHFSQTSFTLAAGTSAIIQVSATVSLLMNRHRRLPIWSGHILIHGSDGSRYRVPYQGMAGNMRTINVQERYNAFVIGNGQNIFAENPEYSMPCDKTTTSGTNATKMCPRLVSWFFMGTPQVNLYVMPTPLDTNVTELISRTKKMDMAQQHQLQYEIADSPLHWRSRGFHLLTEWDGRLKNGSDAVAGTYVIFVKTLRFRGDVSNSSDYEVDATSVFTLNRP